MNFAKHQLGRNAFAIFGTALLLIAAAYVGFAQEDNEESRRPRYVLG